MIDVPESRRAAKSPRPTIAHDEPDPPTDPSPRSLEDALRASIALAQQPSAKGSVVELDAANGRSVQPTPKPTRPSAPELDRIAAELYTLLHVVRSMLDDLRAAIADADKESGRRAQEEALDAIRAAELEVEMLEACARRAA